MLSEISIPELLMILLTFISAMATIITGYCTYYDHMKTDHNKSAKSSSKGKKAGSNINKKSRKRHSRFFKGILIFTGVGVMIIITLIVIKIVKNAKPTEAEAAKETPFSSTSNTPSPLPTDTPIITPTPVPMNSIWLTDLDPLQTNIKNFFFDSWINKAPFIVENRKYETGIGMDIFGTDQEKEVEPPNNEDGNYDPSCKEIYVEYNLGRKYERMTFSIGVDKEDSSVFGSEDLNGKAQVLITDVDHNNAILYNSGWVNYSFSEHDCCIVNLSNVRTLRITFRSKGKGSDHPQDRLRFVIVRPQLFYFMDQPASEN